MPETDGLSVLPFLQQHQHSKSALNKRSNDSFWPMCEPKREIHSRDQVALLCLSKVLVSPLDILISTDKVKEVINQRLIIMLDFVLHT